MEKIGTLFWIVVGLGVFVYRMVMKMQETNARESRERPGRAPGANSPELPATTFQEMLRQMQARNAGAAPEAAPTPPPAQRTLGGRLVPREIARPTRSQERVRVQQTSLEMPAPLVRRASAQLRAGNEAQDSSRVAPARNASPVAQTVRQLLRQPDSVRAAFVLSEIFQRKY